MSVATVQLFYALLGLVATLIVAVMLAAMAVSRWSPGARHFVAAIRHGARESALAGAFVVALLATLGSLYFSEIAHFEPCRLCWYQRIAMYPLVVILGLAARRGDAGVVRYGLALAAIGAVIAGYHYALEWLPSLDSGVCSLGTPCTLVWFREFGFISLPYLSLSAFLLIVVLLRLATPGTGEQRPDVPSDRSAP